MITIGQAIYDQSPTLNEKLLRQSTVDILASPPGSGHLSAANAIEKALRHLEPDTRLRNINILPETSKLFQKLYGNTYMNFIDRNKDHYATFHDFLDRHYDGTGRALRVINNINSSKLIKDLKSSNPELIVCTHFLPAQIASSLKAKGKIGSKIAIVLTDFHVHSLWHCTNIDHYFVAHPNSKLELIEKGVPTNRITVSGIPVDPIFNVKKNSAEMRLKHGLAADLPTILITTGGMGNSSLDGMINDITFINQPLQFVVICGRSENLYNSMLKHQERLKQQRSQHTLHVVGFTNSMDEYMSAADMMIGKAGGLTTSEAIAKVLPTIIVGPLPRHGELNAKFLESKNSVIFIEDTLPSVWIERLLTEQALVAKLSHGMKQIHIRNSATTIAGKLLELLPE